MYNFRRLPVPVVFVMAMLLSAAFGPYALADSYQLTTVSTSFRSNFYGIDGAGDFTVNRGQRQICGTLANVSSCFETFYAGSSIPVYASTAPVLAWDNGSPCTPVLTGFTIASGLCNGAHFLAAGTYQLPDTSELRGIWAGPNPDLLLSLVSYGSIDGGYMNSRGDAVFVDGLDNILVFADDLSTTVTPEPASILLLSTGVLSLAGSMRRRLRR